MSLSAASISHSSFGQRQNFETVPLDSTPPTPAVGAENKVCVECNRALGIGRAITKLWFKGAMDKAFFTEDSAFEDPIARCVGRDEVAESFRAFHSLCEVKALSPPVTSVGADASTLVMHLHHEYRLPVVSAHLEMRSSLVLGLDPMGRIASMVWQWNGVPLLDLAPVCLARSINGWVRALLTPVLV